MKSYRILKKLMIVRVITDMNKWIAEFELEDGDKMPEHMDLEYKGAKIDFHCRPLEQEPCEDIISRKSIKHKLQEHYDFLVDAYGGFSNLPQNDKSRVDEITNCIAMVVNEPSVTPQEPISDILEDIYIEIEKEYKDCVIGKLDDDEMYPCFRQITDIYGLLNIIDKYIDKYKAESEPQESEGKE